MFKPRLHGLLLLVTVAACSRSVRPGSDGGEPGDLAAITPGPDGGAMAAEARLQGKVLAPEGTIPIAGALIFASATPPPPIPGGVYCDKCVHLTVGTPYTRSAADGSFELPLTAGPTHLVVQKGAFRRVRRIDVQPGPQALPKELTTLPAITDAKSRLTHFQAALLETNRKLSGAPSQA